MEQIEDKYQRRAIAGEWHFVLADPEDMDSWVWPGTQVLGVEANGARRFAPPRLLSMRELAAWAQCAGLALRIEERFPVVRRAYAVEMT
jgi:hypothetical protein